LLGFSIWDGVALGFFAACWAAYHYLVEHGLGAGNNLNAIMNDRRRRWFAQALLRDNRILDAQVMNGLQNGTAFFASTSLIAIGGAVTLLRASDQVVQLSADLAFSGTVTRGMWEVKLIGVAVIFAYAFFKFAWSYRLFNYCAILLGALPERGERAAAEMLAEPAARHAVDECVAMNIAAGRHFNRGQRAFFFALAYLGWFLGPAVLALFTGAVLAVMWNRQFRSDAFAAVAAADRSRA
jgi:uncharacterized membrane protein